MTIRTPCDEQADKEHVFAEGEWWCVPKGTNPDDSRLQVDLGQNSSCNCKLRTRHIAWQQLLAIAQNEDDPMYSKGRIRNIEQLEPKHRQDCKQNA